MTEVFSYQIWDYTLAMYATVALKRSAEGIIACTGEIIFGSREDVPDEAVDIRGFYAPASSSIV